MTKYYVALVEDGVPKFSSNPYEHDAYLAAKTEAERLAKLHPGKTFKIYADIGIEVAVPPPPVGVSTSELFSTAKAGVYRTQRSRRGSQYECLVIVGSYGDRSVLFRVGSQYTQLNSKAWTDDRWEYQGSGPTHLMLPPAYR